LRRTAFGEIGVVVELSPFRTRVDDVTLVDDAALGANPITLLPVSP
jgi:hypothetical protein